MAVLIAAAAQADIAGRQTVLNHRALVTLGEWSFAFYLLHSLVLRALFAVSYSPVPVVVSGLMLSVAAAGALHRFVERPTEARLRATSTDPLPLRSRS
jgi:peptidoglycan/LPS O-acetylase OafA/YrhL